MRWVIVASAFDGTVSVVGTLGGSPWTHESGAIQHAKTMTVESWTVLPIERRK